MINYEPGRWQIGLIFQCRGSVFPKAAAWAIPSTVLAMILHVWVIERREEMSMSQFSSYSFVLGFLVVFRSQQAYRRFWEAATLVQQVRGEWFNAISSCVAFCTTDPDRQVEVHKFQHCMIRLASLLYCSSLQQIAVLEDESFDIIELEGFESESLEYLSLAPEKTLVILQWMQQLIIQSHQNGIIMAPAPILSRVFQELSRGIVNIINAQKITDIIFPFPYVQMVSAMLIASALVTPFVLATIMEDIAWCAALNFITIFSLWAINYIAAEIEMPFGDDPNDLPVAALQTAFNQALVMLVDLRCAKCPDFEVTEKTSECETLPCPFYLVTDTTSPELAQDHFKAKKIKESEQKLRIKRANTTVGSDETVSKARRATERMTCRVIGVQMESLVTPGQSSEMAAKSEASLQGDPVADDVSCDQNDYLLQHRFSDSASKQSQSHEGSNAPAITSANQSRSETHGMSLTTGLRIEEELGKLTANLEQRFSLIITNLGLLSKGQNATISAVPPESQLLMLSSLLDNHMALLVQELDKIVQACDQVPSKGPHWPGARQQSAGVFAHVGLPASRQVPSKGSHWPGARQQSAGAFAHVGLPASQQAPSVSSV